MFSLAERIVDSLSCTRAHLFCIVKNPVEFKKSTNEITKDVYDTVCSFSNRDGGIILLGVKDNGEVLGIAPDAVDRMKAVCNHADKGIPVLYRCTRNAFISIDFDQFPTGTMCNKVFRLSVI